MVPQTFTPPDCPLHIFDMDHTLLKIDSEVSWKRWLFEHGLIGITDLFWRDFYFAMYRRGTLNHHAYLKYQLKQIIGSTPDDAAVLFQAHCDAKIIVNFYDDAREILRVLKDKKRTIAVCSATVEPLLQPLVDQTEIDYLMGTKVLVEAGNYSGEIEEPYCAGEGKVFWVKKFCDENNFTLEDAAYYGDNISDIPLLEAVAHPVVCNPTDGLRTHAETKAWPIVNFA